MKSCFSFFKPCSVVMSLYVAVIISYGFYSYYSNKVNTLQNIDEKLFLVASGAKRSLPDDFHDKTIDKNAVSKIADSKNVIALSDYAKKTGVMGVYTLICHNGEIYYTASSKSEKELQNGVETPFFLSYDEASTDVITAFDTTEPTYISESNKWHCLRRVLVPEYSPSGKLYLAGADIDAIHIEKKLKTHLMFSIGIASLFILLTIPFIFLFKKTEKEHVEEFENLKDMLHQRSMDRTTKIEKKINEYINKK